MRKVIVILLLIGCSLQSSAQVVIALLFGDKLNTDKIEFGIVVSPALSNMTGIHCKDRFGLNLGLYFNFKIDDDLFFHPELIAKSSYGAKGIQPYKTGNDSLDIFFNGGSVERHFEGFGMPLLVEYRLYKLLFAVAGPQVDLFLKVNDNFNNKINGSDLNYTIKVTDQYTRFQLGFNAGLIYKLKPSKGMGIGIRYFYGLTDVAKTMEGTQVNAAWLL